MMKYKSFSNISDPRAALSKFRSEVIHEISPRQLFAVSRLEGSDELKRNIFLCYKGKRNKLRIKFEGEEGAGSGPVREFLSCAIKMIDENWIIASHCMIKLHELLVHLKQLEE